MVSVVNNIGDQPYRLLAATIPLASCSLLAGAVITNTLARYLARYALDRHALALQVFSSKYHLEEKTVREACAPRQRAPHQMKQRNESAGSLLAFQVHFHARE
jgi:hypothetical protein